MHSNHKGFTLVELMVVLVILALIVVGVFGVVVIQNKAYHSEEAVIDMQTNAQVALQHISRLIRMAGFGCQENINSGNPIQVDASTSFSTVITATNLNNAPDSLTVVSGLRRVGIIDDGDSIPNEELITTTIPISRDDSSKPLSDFFDDSTTPYKQYFYIFPSISNTFLSISGLNTTSITKTGTDTITVNEGYIVYSVRPYTIRLYTDTQGIPCLGIDDGSGIASYAENIEDLQFQYGWDADNNGSIDTTEWQNAIPAGSEKLVRAVKIYILARSAQPDRDYIDLHDDNTGIAGKQYTLADHTITLDADDSNGLNSTYDQHFHRYLMETTIMVRNLSFQQ